MAMGMDAPSEVLPQHHCAMSKLSMLSSATSRGETPDWYLAVEVLLLSLSLLLLLRIDEEIFFAYL